MRFMLLLKADSSSEAGALKSERRAAALAAYRAELTKAGVLLAAEGLEPTALGHRMAKGEGRPVARKDGPFPEAKEPLAGFWLVDVPSKEAAIEWVKRCPLDAVGGDGGQIEVRTVMDDFPGRSANFGWNESGRNASAPSAATKKQRYMMMFKATPETEAGEIPSEEALAPMGRLMTTMAKKGVLLGGEGLAPSFTGSRVAFAGAKRAVLDGPFAEAKELVCGFWIMQVDSREEALEWALQGLECHGEGESETRLVIDG